MAEKLRSEEQEQSQEINERDIIPFQEQKNQAFENLSAKFVKQTEISGESKKAVGDFLAKDLEDGYKTFAVAWFEEHKDEISEDLKNRGIPMREYSDDEKFGFLTAKKSEGGMGIKPDEEIRKEPEDGKEDYRWIGERMDKIVVLRTDMAKDKIPPETPFLVLHYLQEGLGDAEKSLKELKDKAEAGDVEAEMQAAAKEKELEKLHLAEKELVEKTMHQDLTAMAEQKVAEGGFDTKQERLDDQLEGRKSELEKQRNEELMEREWRQYRDMPAKQRGKYQSELGVRLEMPRDVFDKLYAKQHPSGTFTPDQMDASYEKTNKQFFENAIKQLAKENEIEGPAFYGMLEQGFKPYEEQRKKGIWLLGQTEKISIPRRGGATKEVPTKDYDEFVRRAGQNYKTGIDLRVREEIGNEWEKEHDQKVKVEIDKRIEEVAKSPDAAEKGVEGVYKTARERIMAEEIKKIAERHPKTAEELKVLEKQFEEKEKDVEIGDFIGETYYRRGGLEKLRADLSRDKKVIEKYLSERLGADVDPDVMKEMAQDRYEKAWETRTGLFTLFMELMSQSREKAAKLKSKKPGRKAA